MIMSTSKAGAEQKCLTVVEEYMKSQNRPYSIMDVMMNLHKEFGKTLIIKTLETLVAKGELKEKAVSKQRIFWANQDNLPAIDNAELEALDLEIAKKTSETEALNNNLRTLENKKKSMSNVMTKSQMMEKLAALNDQIAKNEARLTTLNDPNRPTVSAEETEKISSAKQCYTKEWQKRKRMATDILDSILENYPKKKKDLFEEIGIETDENQAP